MASIKKNPIDEAKRYMDNAREILSTKAKKDGDYYSDPKYVKMAGNTAWNGVLVALDGVLNVKKAGTRKDFDDYKSAVYKKDKKMTRPLQSAYEALHLHLGYDGTLRYKVVQDGLEQGRDMINWAAKYYKQQ
ncbi:MAG: DUF5618 family protein [Bacteroidales bacterium]|jgi:ABC-type Fe3+ transport system substrate-binding protein|nr:DUF5618 family protein [Bacteroidales bacterium]